MTLWPLLLDYLVITVFQQEQTSHNVAMSVLCVLRQKGKEKITSNFTKFAAMFVNHCGKSVRMIVSLSLWQIEVQKTFLMSYFYMQIQI